MKISSLNLAPGRSAGGLLRVARLVIVGFAAIGASSVRADLILNTPSGLSAGDTFRFIFITKGGTTATSNVIGDYDTFVRNDVAANFGTVTYNGVAITDWLVLGSGATENAFDHLGGAQASVSIWTPTGSLFATSQTTATGGLWSGDPFGVATTYLDGVGGDLGYSVWTGSWPSGQSLRYFGHPTGFITVGWNWTMPNALAQGSGPDTNAEKLLGVSPVLTAVPEPSTYAMALAGLACGGFSMWRRRKRA